MGWLLSERRGKKQGWMEESLASVSLPPSPLLALVAIFSVLLLFSSYTSYKYQMQRTQTGFNIFLFLLPALLISLAHFLIKNGGFPGMSSRTKEAVVRQDGGGGGGASPWGVALVLGIMLVLLSQHSSFQSMWRFYHKRSLVVRLLM